MVQKTSCWEGREAGRSALESHHVPSHISRRYLLPSPAGLLPPPPKGFSLPRGLRPLAREASAPTPAAVGASRPTPPPPTPGGRVFALPGLQTHPLLHVCAAVFCIIGGPLQCLQDGKTLLSRPELVLGWPERERCHCKCR